MRARRLSPTARVLLFSSILPDDVPHSMRLLAGRAEERQVVAGEVLLREEETASRFWFAVDATVQRHRNGITYPPFTSPTPVGLLELLSQDTVGTRLEVVEGGLVLEVDGNAAIDALIDTREGIVTVLTRLGFAVAQLGTLLPRPDDQRVDVPPTGELTLVDRLLLLGANGILGQVPLDLVAPLARRLETVHLRPGERIYTHGVPTGFGLFLARGTLLCVPPEGESATAHVGATLGFMDHLVFGAPTFDAVAQSDVVAMTLPVQVMIESMETHPDLARAIIRGLATALVDAPVLIEAAQVSESLERELASLQHVR